MAENKISDRPQIAWSIPNSYQKFFDQSEAEGWLDLELGWQKKSEQKKGTTTTTTTSTTNFIPGQTIHFLVEFFAFLSLFQPPKTFSYVFHFHNLSKRHSEKTIFARKFFWKKKKSKKIIHFFFFFFDFFFFRFFVFSIFIFFSNFFFFDFFLFEFFFFEFFPIFFFLCPKPTRHLFLSILL